MITKDQLVLVLNRRTSMDERSRLHGPYNTLLNSIFEEEEFMSCPDWFLTEQYERVMSFVVVIDTHPIFILHIRNNIYSKIDTLKQAADYQIRIHLTSFLDALQHNKLIGINVIGTKFCIYIIDKTTHLILIQYPSVTINGPCYEIPLDKWYDITTDEGFNKFVEVALSCKP